MTTTIKTILKGKQTRRGVGITRTVSCQMRAAFNPDMAGMPLVTVEVPNSFPSSIPGRLLSSRHGIYIKYFNIGDPGGKFRLIERQTTQTEVTARGYPIIGVSGPETLKEKRLKQVFLPITGSLRIYSGAPAVEGGSTLEYG